VAPVASALANRDEHDGMDPGGLVVMQERQVMMIASLLTKVTRVGGTRIRFMRGEDENGTCVMGFALGGVPDDPDAEREMVGFVSYDDGRFGGPEYLHPEGRQMMTAMFDL
jgi:hypothetical protein